MLAEAAEDSGVKAPPPQTPARRRVASSRGLLDRVQGWLLFTAIDGRSTQRARANAPFEPRGSRGFMLLALVPGLLLLIATGAIFWRPLMAEPDVLSAIPVDPPSQTPVERKLIGNIAILRDGVWEAKLPPWSDVPLKGMARVSNPEVHADLVALLAEIRNFGDAIGNHAPPDAHRDPVFLGQVADLRQRLGVLDGKLGGVRAVTAYHLGLLSLWAGDAADAEPQFASALDIARKTAPVDDVGKQRLDGIEASAAYGHGLSEAGRGLWQAAIADFDAALTASCRAAADGNNNMQGDTGFALGRANLVALDTRSIRNDRLIALLHVRTAAVTSPSCGQLLSPSQTAPRGDADAEARALFAASSAAGDPTLAANLQLRAALMGARDVVQQLSFDASDAGLGQAQALARAIAGLDPATDARGVDKSALADLQKISVLKARFAAQLRNGTLSEPENDPAWNWSDPSLFRAWKTATASAVASELLGAADAARDDNPGLAAALYGVVLDNRAWLPGTAVFDAWWRLNTGTSLSFVLTMLAVAAAITGLLLLVLLRWRQTYRIAFESWHHSDRMRAPEG